MPRYAGGAGQEKEWSQVFDLEDTVLVCMIKGS